MIQLIRVYRDGRVVAAEAYDHDEYPPALPPHLRCRCLPTPVWWTRKLILAQEIEHDKITVDSIYLSHK